jgi:hypothetical protein
VGPGPRQRIVLLPERRRLAGAPSPRLARQLVRAERSDASAGDAGEQAQLQRWFDIEPAGWPIAALQRQAEAGDAGDATWLRADPVHVRAELAGARLMAWGSLGIDAGEADAFLDAIAPLLAEEGMDIGRTAPDCWYLRLPAGVDAPADTAAPADALGEDLLPHLPAGDAGRRWRRLSNELQVLLHQHPLNAARLGRGVLAVNSLWFWGGGRLPSRVASPAASFRSDEPSLRALATAAGLAEPPPGRSGDVDLLDLRRTRAWTTVEAAFSKGAMSRDGVTACLDFSDGQSLSLPPPPRWAFWRR